MFVLFAKHCGVPLACAGFFCLFFLQGNTRTLVFMVTSAAVGGTLQYGYNLAIMNAPTVVSKHESVYISLFTHDHVFMCMILNTSKYEYIPACS